MTEGELFEQYVIEAFNSFVENHDYLELKAPTSFETFPVDMDNVNVGCEVNIEEDTSVFCVNITEGTVTAIKADLDLNDESDQFTFKLRVYWMIHHEIAHWLWGHIKYYEEKGWATALGLSEGDAKALSPESDKPIEIHDLAHTAELQADAFAAIELFNFLSRYDDGEEYDRFLTAQLALYSIMTTVAIFYGDREEEVPTSLHPKWSTRSINLLRGVFECFLVDSFGEDQIHAGMRLSAEALNPIAIEFTEQALFPALEACAEFARVSKLPESLFPLDGTGLLDTKATIAVMSKSRGSHESVDRILDLFDRANDWIAMLDTYSPVKNFDPVSAFGEDMSTNPNQYRYKIGTDLTEDETKNVIAKWARENNLDVKSVKVSKGVGIDTLMMLVDLAFEAMKDTSPDQIKTYMDYLKAALQFQIDKVSRKTNEDKGG